MREPAEAYAADALAALADLPSRSERSLEHPERRLTVADDTGEMVEDWSFAKMIVRVDLTALDRGSGGAG